MEENSLTQEEKLIKAKIVSEVICSDVVDDVCEMHSLIGFDERQRHQGVCSVRDDADLSPKT